MEPSEGLMINESSTDPVKIYCTYTANPSQLMDGQITWFKDGQRIPIPGSSVVASALASSMALITDRDTAALDKYRMTLLPGSYPLLTIYNVSRSDQGKYTCEVANS